MGRSEPSDATLEQLLQHGSAEKSLKGEDVHLTVTRRVAGEAVVIVLVADGHGGGEAAQYCRDKIPAYLCEAAADGSGAALAAAARDAFARADQGVQELVGTTAGATLSLVVLNLERNELTCANVGDSAVLHVPSAKSEQAVFLSTDHRLETNEDERKRIAALGGTVARANIGGQPCGPLRVYPGGLAMSRSIGDSDAIGDGGASLLAAEPSVTTITLPDDEWAIVSCSDGVWDSLSSAAVARPHRTALGQPRKVRTTRGSLRWWWQWWRQRRR